MLSAAEEAGMRAQKKIAINQFVEPNGVPPLAAVGWTFDQSRSFPGRAGRACLNKRWRRPRGSAFYRRRESGGIHGGLRRSRRLHVGGGDRCFVLWG